MDQLFLKELIQSQIQKALLENSESIVGKALPTITLRSIYHSSDATIFRDPSGELIYFNSNALDDSEYEDYAKSGISSDLTTTTGKWHLDKDTVENYVNTNLNTLSVGTGLIDYEKANTDLVKIDNDLRKELLKTSPFIKDRAQRAEYQKSLLEQIIKKQVQKSLLEMERHDDRSVSGKTTPNIVLDLLYNSKQDVAIFQDKQGETYIYNIESVPKEEYEEYADRDISFDGRDEDGFPETTTSEWSLDDSTIENYVNDNLSTLSKGVGLSDYESDTKSLVKVDDTLKKDLTYILKHIKDPDKKMKFSKALLEQKIKETIISVIRENLEVSPDGLEDEDKELPEFSQEVEVFLQSFKDHRFLSKSLDPKLRQYYEDKNFEGAYNEIVAAFRPYYEKYEPTLGYQWDMFHEWVQGIKDETLPFSSSGSFATALMDDDFFFGEAYEKFNLENNEVEQLIKENINKTKKEKQTYEGDLLEFLLDLKQGNNDYKGHKKEVEDALIQIYKKVGPDHYKKDMGFSIEPLEDGGTNINAEIGAMLNTEFKFNFNCHEGKCKLIN